MSILPQNTAPNELNIEVTTPKNANNNTQSKHGKVLFESSNPNDDSIIDLKSAKKLKAIDYHKMRETVKNTHATKPNGEYYSCKEACWNFNTGHHGCIESSEKSDLTKFGVGIILYFKFVKRLILFFALFTLLSLPAYVFYISSFASFNKNNTDSLSYLDLLQATTVGAIGLGSTSCGVRKFKNGSDKQKEMMFNCPSGTIADVDNIVYGLVKQGTTCNFVDTNDLILICNTYKTDDLRAAFQTCIGSKSCKITPPDSIFKSGDTICENYYKTLNAYMRISCDVSKIKVADKNLSKSVIAYIVAFFDAAIVILFLVMLHTLKYAQRKATTNVQKKAYSASSYTVELFNLPQSMPAEELSAKLWVFLDKKLGEKSVQAGHRVVDIQIVLPTKLIEYNKKYGAVIHQKNELIRDFMEAYAPTYDKDQIDFNGLQAVMKQITEASHAQLKEAEKEFKKIRNLSFKKMKILSKIQKLKTTKQKIISAFVTFSSIPARDKILDSFINSPLDRILRLVCSCLYDKDISFHGKILRARTAADPGSILWENLGEPGPKIFGRRILSAVLTLILWVFSAVILIISTYYKNNFKKTFPTVDCDGSGVVSAGQAADDFLLGEYQIGLLQCYCQQDLLDNLYHKFASVNNQTLCLNWFTHKVLETTITFAVVFVVLLVNYSVQFVFQGLSRFEKHSTLNRQITTRVLKTFVAQFLNTGLMILIVNIKFDVGFWQGQFRDITPLWYDNVGSTLLSTMFINIVTGPSVRIVFLMFRKLLRFCDRRCGSDPKITKKTTQTAYEKVYSGPEFIIDFRYSQILTMTFVCFLYSGGMPLLYFSTLLQLSITYFFDKVWLLKVNKLPKNYDHSLEAVVRSTMYIALIAHLVFAIFMFGNSEIFSQDTLSLGTVSSSVKSIANNISDDDANVVSKFFKRTVLNFNIVLTVVLLLIIALFLVKDVLIGVLKRTVFAPFSADEEKTQKKGKKVTPNKIANFTFFHVIQTEDLAKLIKLTKVTLKNTQNEDLANQLKMKLALLKQEYLIKQQELQQPISFIGFYTYDVRLQDRYADQFAIGELLDNETLD